MADALVVFGDSATWGQGLKREHTYSYSIANHYKLQEQMIAHSGATIGVGDGQSGPTADPEVPLARPTILQQVASFTGNPDEVAVIILDGGINDVDVRFILNPINSPKELRARTLRYCQDDMLTLLKEVTDKFRRSDLRIVVTSYFPILSSKSEPFKVPLLLAVHGIAMSPFATQKTVFDKIVAQCQQFYTDSTAALKKAIQRCADIRVRFAAPPFGDDNAVFAPTPWLWGIKSDLLFSPQDEVIQQRHAACNIAHDPGDLLGREGCYRASAGHPNRTGADQFAATIIDVLD
jgi:lysophospholipase L1-like esterase